jgi:N-acetylglutamate synthase-like GNAT family acetyltransferase
LWEEGKIVGVAILDSEFIGRLKDQLQLKFLHVSRDYRQRGLGRLLFELASMQAREWRAHKMYISATLRAHGWFLPTLVQIQTSPIRAVEAGT